MAEDTLKKLHEALLRILDEIDRICRKNDIPYFLDSGTALGAVRHKGFIPWDDDADVGMLRENYERFLEAAKTDLGEEFFLQTTETDPDYPKFSAKIRLNNTYFPEKRNDNSSIHAGIFVDVFPFDYINDDEKKAQKDIKKMRVLNRMYALRVRRPQDENAGRKLLRACARILPKSFYFNKCVKHLLKYKKTGTVTCYPYKMNNSMFLRFPVEDMAESVDIPFEDRTYQIMKNYDHYLTIMYSDYMKLPPEEKRVWHFDGEIRFE